MKRLCLFCAMVLCVLASQAYVFEYDFDSQRLSDALTRVADEHPDLCLNFIYNELDNYDTSAKILTDDVYDALLTLVGKNPVSVLRYGDKYYVEALQRGEFTYSGRAIDGEGEPVAATVLLLAPKDSTVITYGMAEADGRFSIPCDRRQVLAKLSCIGYHTVYRICRSFDMGDVVMPVNALSLRQLAVEEQLASAYSDRTVYTPTSRQKNASQNAYDLLRHMAIPQIQVQPVTNSVKTNGGQQVSVFINYLPASAEEMEGLWPKEVRRVEYLEFPVDPRFCGAARVINFIVQGYKYGGYTKISADENLLTGLASRARVFTKFTYGKMTYDVYASAANADSHHAGSDESAMYSLKADGDRNYELLRSENAVRARVVANQYPVTVRATYSSDKVQIRNVVGYSHSSNPVEEQSGTLTYHPDTGASLTFSRSNPSHSNSLSYEGYYFLALPRAFSVNVTPQLSYTHNNNDLTYTGSLSQPLIRKARENACSYRVNAYLNRLFGQKNTLMLGFNGGKHINRLRYSGNEVYFDRFSNLFVAGMLCYQLRAKKISLYTDIGVCLEQSDINGLKNTDKYPFIHINCNYSPNSKNAFSSYFQYANSTPGIDQKASDILRDNEYMYIAGNPLLANSRHVTFELAYTWMPSNQFNSSFFGNFFKLYDRDILSYEPYDNGHAILRTYINSGNFTQTGIGMSAIVRLFDKTLELYVSPRQYFYRSTGIYKKSYNPFQIQSQATLFIKNFYIQASYLYKQNSMYQNSPVIFRSHDIYTLGAGWSNANWNMRLTAFNFFNRHWVVSRLDTESPLYSASDISYGTTSHARINLAVTYTFGYGKKARQGGEVGELQGASSAILK